ncbi:hypothetical protein ACIQZG_22535 [Lysinibacillus sp. NPDC096418]|uniref:hypothetical protein n=1 Tax=Lysinibacillus sp. NPDC096418 TaxID=3364138 RepID=UPI003810D3F8
MYNDIPISLTKLAKEKGIPIQRFKAYCPNLSKEISLGYKTYLSEMKMKKVELYLKEVRRVANDLHQKGIYPSTYKIRQELNSSDSIFLYKEVEEGWKELVILLGYKVK